MVVRPLKTSGGRLSNCLLHTGFSRLLHIGHFAVILRKVETVDVILVCTEDTGLGNVGHLPAVLMIWSGL